MAVNKKQDWVNVGRLGAAHKLQGAIKLHVDESIIIKKNEINFVWQTTKHSFAIFGKRNKTIFNQRFNFGFRWYQYS